MPFADAAGRCLLLLLLLVLLLLRRIVRGRLTVWILHILIFVVALVNRFIRYDEIVVMLPSLHIFFLRSDDSAAIFLVPLARDESLCIYH